MSRTSFFLNSIYLQYLVFLILCHSNKLNFSGFSLKGVFMIFQMWKKSLDFFKPESLKVFFLVSLNNTKRSITLLIKKFWWLSLFVFPFYVVDWFFLFSRLNLNLIVYNFAIQHMYFNIVILSLFLLFVTFVVYLFYLSVRPSIEAKDKFYYKKYLKKFPMFLLMCFIIFIFLFSLVNIFGMLILKLRVPFSLIIFLSSFLMPIINFMIFFFLDSKKRFLDIFISAYKGLKLTFYFVPAILFLISISFMVSVLPKFFVILPIFGKLISLILSIVFFIFNLSLFVNYYTMLRHKHYEFLYGKQS